MIPSSIEDVVRKGEEKLDERINMLRLADKGGWDVVDAYVTEPVCDNDEDDKKWKRAVRQVKEDAEGKRKKTVWRVGCFIFIKSSYFIPYPILSH